MIKKGRTRAQCAYLPHFPEFVCSIASVWKDTSLLDAVQDRDMVHSFWERWVKIRLQERDAAQRGARWERQKYIREPSKQSG